MGCAMKKWILLVVLCIIGSPIYASVTMEKVDDVPWKIDSDVTYYGAETLKTGSITDSESTSVVLTFPDVDGVELFIKTSTEGGFDKLTIECNGSTYEYSGENVWESVWLDLEGGNAVTLTYSKDGSVLNGDDCCWIWFDGIESLVFNDTDDSDAEPEKGWDMSTDSPWYYCGSYTDLPPESESRPYIEAPVIEDGKETWISYEVEGTQVFSFKYLIVSDESVSPLIVSVDGVDVTSFGGRKIFESYVVVLPDCGRHTIKWTYRKPIGTSCSSPRIWFEGVEKVVLENAGFSMNTQYPWDSDWENCYDGMETLRSGTVFEGEAASFSVTVQEEMENLQCALKVSSEEEHDFLKVYLNEELVYSISGETDWESLSLEVVLGDVIRFEYAKDNNSSTSGQDCGWVYFDGINDYMSLMHLFPEDATPIEETQTVGLNLNTGRDAQRGILDGDDGVSFASGEYPAWIHDENESAMGSAEIARGRESWMSATVVGKGTFSFRWKCSGETLSCYVDGELKETLYGASDWTDVDVALENDARHEIKWVFARGEDSNDVAACGWVDGIVWEAPEGWDDPDEPIVPATVSTFIPLDLRPSPRILDTTNFCERITYDPAWRNAASVALSVNASEAVKTTESGAYEWKSEKEGLFEMKLEFLDSVGAAIGEPLTASFKIALDPLPALGENATADDVATILGGVADAKLKVNVADATDYANFRAWLEAKGIDHNDAAKSLFAWLSYALDTAGLVAAGPKEGDLKIDSFESSSTDGAFEFTVKLKDIAVGDGALEDNLKKVFDIEGREKLSSGEFSSNAVQINAAQADNGNVKFTVTPKVEKDEKPTSFFFKVKMK